MKKQTTSWQLPQPLGIIAGSGFYNLDALQDAQVDASAVQTPYGDAASSPVLGQWHGQAVAFLTRHGGDHRLAPHRVNYRANLWALKQVGVQGLLLVNCVGGIHLGPGSIAIPDQVVDYTWGRESTFFEDEVRHTDMTAPFCADLRERLLHAGRDQEVRDGGVYGCTQGPRLETAAEINRLERDGVDLVGMTAAPEAFLARELEWPCAMLSLVVNYAAGHAGNSVIDQEDVSQFLEQGMPRVQAVIGELLAASGAAA